jgi:prepilin-type N-terminal cleavage/methylation domain-containing protein
MQSTQKTIHDNRGVTLVEMLVTLVIFSFVTLVLTNSMLSILSSRNQTEVYQSLNDELRLTLDTMELEITSGSNFSTSDCSLGVCRSVEFSVATRPDIVPYRVRYSYDMNTQTIQKTTQRNDGVCKTLPLPAGCTFPITSSDVRITAVNFDVTTSGTGAQRPIVTVVIEGESTTGSGEIVPLSYSTSYSPRVVQNVTSVQNNTDSTPPSVLFDAIVPSGSSDACSGIYEDAALSIPYDNSRNWVEDQVLPDAYTDCDLVEISFYGTDAETGIAGGRYDGYVNVNGGLCNHQACSEYPRGAYTIPFGTTMGVSEAYFTYDEIPLRPGIGVNNAEQRIYLRVEDMEGNINNSPESYIDIYHVGSLTPVTTAGMEGLARLSCWSAGEPSVMLMVAPSANSNVYQRNIRWYRCVASDEFDTCDPQNDVFGDSLQLTQHGSDLEWKANAGAGSYTSGYDYIFYNGVIDDPPFVTTDVLYRYGFTVYDPYDPARESSLQLIEWDRGF